ncbi:SgrR family transcriptional regulator [Anoxybacillus tepidamans]|uniref:SgrR family transcriptional regulator n=1 Tax=Anoxybacteroides tepidamans TaxID=265948 RepID=UPI000487D4D1|nr:SgrR family transcriptional regulator [Anoxybacillus tepidamans]
MKLIEHYIRLRLAKAEQEQNNKLMTSIKQVAESLCCTEKNAKLVLKKLEEKNFLTWERGQGRGRCSILTFHKDLYDAIISHFNDLLDHEKIPEAMNLLKGTLPSHIKEELTNRLYARFGYSANEQNKEILKIPLSRSLSTLDPAFIYVTTESHIIRQIFDTLVIYKGETKRIEPHLAHYWETDRYKQTWTLYLRKGVRFHHGRILTAKDVIYTVNRLNEMASPWFLQTVKEIDSPSPLIVTFRLHRPDSLFLHYLSLANMVIMPYDVPFNETKLIGSGPFMMQNYTNEVLTLDAFPDYFKERAHLDRIQFWFLPKEAAIQRNYELPADLYTWKNDQEIAQEEVGCRYLLFNFQKPGPQHDVHFRKAMHQLMDGSAAIAELGGMRFKEAASFFPQKSKLLYVPKSLAAAKELLQKSTYNSEDLKLYCLDFQESKEDAKWFQKRCETIGIRLSVHPFSMKQYYSKEATNDADMVLMSEVFDIDYHVSFLSMFRNNHSFLYRFLTKQQKKKIETKLNLFAAMNEKERELMIDEIEDLLRKEQWLIFHYHVLKKRSYPNLLRGMKMNAFGWADFRQIWINPNTASTP